MIKLDTNNKSLIKIDETMGSWSKNKFDINYSSILTRLIKESAKCDRYSSDLFIDWLTLDKNLKEQELKSHDMLFGFRDDGVDHKAFVEIRGEDVYSSIYKLNVDVKFPDIKMTLYKIKGE